jgi:hypothetical protein
VHLVAESLSRTGTLKKLTRRGVAPEEVRTVGEDSGHGLRAMAGAWEAVVGDDECRVLGGRSKVLRNGLPSNY